MVFFLPVRNLWSVGCRPADATMYDGRGYDGEENAFGFFDGCTMTPAADYPPGLYGGPSAYPPDAPTDCSPNCYMQTPESIRGKAVVVSIM